MTDNGCQTIDTKAFDAVMDIKDELVSDYDKLNSEYDRIIETLLSNWQGKGADAFREDATKVKTNIGGIHDILNTMCDTLTDCRSIIAETDTAMGDFNSKPFEQ